MRFAACVLTRNQYEHGRRDLFERTVDSLKSAGVELYVVDNGSTDGTDSLVKSAVDWTPHCSTADNTTSGFGTWLCCRVLAGSGADVCVVSDDDMEWDSGFTVPLADWWSHAPNDLLLTGGHLEPEFPWNAIEERVKYGDTIGLLRASTGAASWTFRRNDYERLVEVWKSATPDAVKYIQRFSQQGVWDEPMCQFIQRAGYKIGQLDLADHAGQGRSTWGNGTESMYGWDVDPVRESL